MVNAKIFSFNNFIYYCSELFISWDKLLELFCLNNKLLKNLYEKNLKIWLSINTNLYENEMEMHRWI